LPTIKGQFLKQLVEYGGTDKSKLRDSRHINFSVEAMLSFLPVFLSLSLLAYKLVENSNSIHSDFGIRFFQNLKMMEQEDEQDILPDTDVDRERSLTGRWALFVLVCFPST
jgi:hypothetical protein